MGPLGMILYGIGAIGSLVCLILVIMKMFQNGQSTLGIVCIVLSVCTGIGALIAFVYGWIKHREWGITNVMIAWNCFMVLGFIGVGIYLPTMQFAPQPVVLPR